jgi:hypothetical protein
LSGRVVAEFEGAGGGDPAGRVAAQPGPDVACAVAGEPAVGVLPAGPDAGAVGGDDPAVRVAAERDRAGRRVPHAAQQAAVVVRVGGLAAVREHQRGPLAVRGVPAAQHQVVPAAFDQSSGLVPAQPVLVRAGLLDPYRAAERVPFDGGGGFRAGGG